MDDILVFFGQLANQSLLQICVHEHGRTSYSSTYLLCFFHFDIGHFLVCLFEFTVHVVEPRALEPQFSNAPHGRRVEKLTLLNLWPLHTEA